MTESVVNFPSQAVSDLEKLSEKYGLQVAKAIRQEWFSGATSKFNTQISTSDNSINNRPVIMYSYFHSLIQV